MVSDKIHSYCQRVTTLDSPLSTSRINTLYTQRSGSSFDHLGALEGKYRVVLLKMRHCDRVDCTYHTVKRSTLKTWDYCMQSSRQEILYQVDKGYQYCKGNSVRSDDSAV